MSVPTSPHAAAIIGALETAGILVGDGRRPPSVPEDPASPSWQPYVVFWVAPGGLLDGSLSNPESEIDGRFSLVGVGRHAGEARKILDDAKAAIEAGFLVTGRRIERVRCLQAQPSTDRDDSTEPPLWFTPCSFGFWSFPAT